jgi:hypothetical protein
MTEHLDKLIDSRNKNLWDELNLQFEFILEESPEPNYMSLIEDNTAIIKIYKNDLSPSSFTHELLHVYLRSKKVFIQNELLKIVTESPELRTLFSLELVEHIGNCLEHFIMLPIFLKMGFTDKEFLSDFNETKMTTTFFEAIKSRYRTKEAYDREAVDVYIGKFFAMKSCNNKKFKYFEHYMSMQKLDKKMYKLLYDFWSDWETFDFLDPEDSYSGILEYFVTDLKTWLSNKTLV